MTELSADEVMVKLPALLAGGGWIDERVMLEAELSPTNQDQVSTHRFYALNDVVLSRGAIARVVYVDTSVDNQPMITYKADGVIVATATGSTGYSLAAGGPILHPRAKELLLLPMLPHLSSAYCLILPSTAVIELRINTDHQAELNIDGHINVSLSSGSTVTVKQSSATARFLRIHLDSFYSSLGQKLKGKQ
jgi:NAD+ kinase